MYRNLVTSLLKHDKMVTTEAKAKEIKPMAEKMITLAKKGDLPSRRTALSFITEKDIVKKLFSEVGPRYAQRTGGYTRITRLGPRLGDGAEMAKIELT
jgi:large subunit ribosomal protein L17